MVLWKAFLEQAAGCRNGVGWERMMNGIVPAVLVIGLGALALTGCVPTPVLIPAIAETANLTQHRIEDRYLPSTPPRGLADRVPLPSGPVPVPGYGDANSYGLLVGPDLANTYAALADGDAERGFLALERAEASQNPGLLWQVSFLRAGLMQATGQVDHALAETEVIARRERAWLGHDLNATALRGELLLDLGNPQAALSHLADVDERTRAWRLPTEYTSPPSNLAEIVALTTAQLRAYAGLARLYFQVGQFAAAEAWATAGEERYSDIHLVASHPQFGRYVPVYDDSYLARAANLAIRGAARLALNHDRHTALADLRDASLFYEAIGDPAGSLSAAAVQARGHLAAGEADAARLVASEAARRAGDLRDSDLQWRLLALEGEAQSALSQWEEAGKTFQAAQDAASLASGSLAIDQARHKFGVAKADLGARLARIAWQRGDLATVVRALERARSQEVLDLTADLTLEMGPDAPQMAELRRLDRAIRFDRLKRRAPANGRQHTAPAEDSLTYRNQLLGPLLAGGSVVADLSTVVSPALTDLQMALAEGEVLAIAAGARETEPLTWVVADRRTVQPVTSAITGQELRGLLEGFAGAVAHRDTEAQAAIAARIGVALDLPRLARTGALYVVPLGESTYVPWGALDIRTPVVVLPAAGALLRPAARLAAAATRAVVIGGAGPASAVGPNADALAIAVARGLGVEPLVGNRATESELRRAVDRGTAILQFTGGGRFDGTTPLASAINLTIGDPPGGGLSAERLIERPLPARLAVLASTDTGFARGSADQGFWMLARSLYQGGTGGVLFSLWPVEETVAREFLIRFYQALGAGDDWARAWLTARNQMKAQGFPPAAYGAYLLTGAARG